MATPALAPVLLRLNSIGAMLIAFHQEALAQCEVGQVREVTVPCNSGRMTCEPRTHECILPSDDG